jgi:hypothetical protein
MHHVVSPQKDETDHQDQNDEEDQESEVLLLHTLGLLRMRRLS